MHGDGACKVSADVAWHGEPYKVLVDASLHFSAVCGGLAGTRECGSPCGDFGEAVTVKLAS